MRRYHRGTVPVLFYKTPTMTRRADRLFQIAELLRGRRLTTAQQLADWLNISLRTVYRDVRDLQLSGVPIEGEAGIGYRLSRAASLPPLTFTADELAAPPPARACWNPGRRRLCKRSARRARQDCLGDAGGQARVARKTRCLRAVVSYQE